VKNQGVENTSAFVQAALSEQVKGNMGNKLSSTEGERISPKGKQTALACPRCSGQSAVETALILPICLALMMGIIEGGRLIYTALVLNSAARAGVQYGAQSLATAADIQGMENAAVLNAQGLPNLSATASCYIQCGASGQIACGAGTCSAGQQGVFVTVNVSAGFQPMITLPGLSWPSSVSSQATLRVD